MSEHPTPPDGPRALEATEERPSAPRPVTVEHPGMAGHGDLGPEPDSKLTYLANMTAHDLRVRMEETQKYTERRMRRTVEEAGKQTEKRVKLATWVQTAIVSLGIYSGAAFTGWIDARTQRAATAETKATVKEAVAPVEKKLDQALDGGLPAPGPPWAR